MRRKAQRDPRIAIFPAQSYAPNFAGLFPSCFTFKLKKNGDRARLRCYGELRGGSSSFCENTGLQKALGRETRALRARDIRARSG